MTDIKATPEGRTGFRITMTVGMELTPWLGRQAWELRQCGFQIDEKVPDCAVLHCREGGFCWKWVNATFTIKSDTFSKDAP